MPRSRKDLSVRTVDGEVIVLDRRSNQVHQLNRTAGMVWQRCDGRHDVDRISAEIAELFGIDPARAKRDAARAIGEFVRLGLLEAASPAVLQ